MKFIIDQDAFNAQEETHETIPLKLVESGRMLFLKPSAKPLLHAAGWTDFDAFAFGADEALRMDFEDAITALECFDLARVQERSGIAYKQCCVAGERDYALLAQFMQHYLSLGLSFTPVETPLYYSLDNVRLRQFTNTEYHFMKMDGSELLAVLVVGVPPGDDVSSVATFGAVVFRDTLDEAACRACLKDLLDFAAFEFRGELNRFRFLHVAEDPRQKQILPLLTDYGFQKICTLEKEILQKIDLKIYDYITE